MSEQYLCLKWGTIKGFDLTGNPKALEALNRYYDEPTAYGAMQRRDTPSQKAAICDVIDAIDGEIYNDWSGETYSKEQAKKYVLEYGQ